MPKRKWWKSDALFFSWRLYIDIGRHNAGYFSVLLFKAFYTSPNQDKNLTINGPALIIRNITQLFQHLFFNSYGNTLNSHRIHLRWNYDVFILIPKYGIMVFSDILHIYKMVLGG